MFVWQAFTTATPHMRPNWSAALAQGRSFALTLELLAAVDVVHVLTPPASHAALTLQALEAGCDVFVEKPLATSAAECQRIAAAGGGTGTHRRRGSFLVDGSLHSEGTTTDRPRSDWPRHRRGMSAQSGLPGIWRRPLSRVLPRRWLSLPRSGHSRTLSDRGVSRPDRANAVAARPAWRQSLDSRG